MKKASRFLMINTIVMGMVFSLGIYSYATDYYWKGDTGYWDDPSNWSPYGLPSGDHDDNVTLTNSSGFSATAFFESGFYNLRDLTIYGTGPETMTLLISDGGLTIFSGFILQNNGILTQTGGNTNFTSGISIDQGGTYNLAGGNFDVGENLISVSGTFNQSGGAVGMVRLTPDAIFVGSGGVYNLNNGVIRSAGYGADVIHSGGVFNHYGGEIYRKYGLVVHGTYNLTAGNMYSEKGLSLIENGIFNQSGGLNHISGGSYLDPSNSLLIGYTSKWENGKYTLVKTSGIYNLLGGRLETELGILVGDKFNYSGGELILGHTDHGVWVPGTFTNNGNTNLSGTGTRTVNGNVINNGTFKTTHTVVVFTGIFTNNGAYISDPATQHFNTLIIGQNGYLVGQHGDKFYISADFVSNSNMNAVWNTSHAYLGFVAGQTSQHALYITGADYGSTMSGFANNFSWGTLDITGNMITLFDGNTDIGGALYLRSILGLQIQGNDILNISSIDGLDIYYVATLPSNGYLYGLTYDLAGGGHLRPIVGTPEPITLLLLGLGLIALVGLRRK